MIEFTQNSTELLAGVDFTVPCSIGLTVSPAIPCQQEPPTYYPPTEPPNNAVPVPGTLMLLLAGWVYLKGRVESE
jgi:hypothetical protein